MERHFLGAKTIRRNWRQLNTELEFLNDCAYAIGQLETAALEAFTTLWHIGDIHPPEQCG